MGENISILDRSVVEELKRFPTAELVRLIFPGHPVRTRGIMRSPFREDRNPSFSCFKGRDGCSLWKDHSTQESGDNIDLYRKAFPDLGYVEAVDRLALLVLGRSAVEGYAGGVRREYRSVQARRASFARTIEPERESALKVISDLPLTDGGIPAELRRYWRNRGISDRVICGLGLRYVVFENINRKGMTLMDPASGLPLVENGRVMRDDGLSDAIGLYNDIGGVIFRVPDSETHRGFKGGTSSFITTILADGSRPAGTVTFEGVGTNMINYLRYDGRDGALLVNPTQSFRGLAPHAVPFAAPLLEDYMNVTLSVREVKCLTAVLNSLNAPMASEVAVVEGMFDGLSERELNRLRDGSSRGRDLIIANSIGNLRWAVPFICRHRQATLMLDNDGSGAGQKAYAQLCNDMAAYNSRTGSKTVIVNGSALFEGYKDLNEALMAGKGFPVGMKAPSPKGGGRRNAPSL